MRSCALFASIALGIVTASGCWSAGRQTRLDNGYFRLDLRDDGRVSSLRCDPLGNGAYGPNWVTGMGFEGLRGKPSTRVSVTGQTVQLDGMEMVVSEEIGIHDANVAHMLNPGHTLGQAFTVERGSVVRIAVKLPTWNTKTSGCTLSLLRGGPGGECIARRKLTNVPDNSWQELTFAPHGPGGYYVEISDPSGQIGWWSLTGTKQTVGAAYADGGPAADTGRTLRIGLERTAGSASLTVRLDGNRAEFSTRVSGAQRESKDRSVPMLMNVRWDNAGYDVSSRSVPFSRFLTDNMRYMPTQQLKRWKDRDGHYELSFGDCRWIEADGTGAYDLRFSSDKLWLSWWMKGKETELRFSSPPKVSDDGSDTSFVVELRPRDDGLPADWPRFSMPDKQAEAEANTFLYERGFSWGSLWGPAPWADWTMVAQVWQRGRQTKDLRKYLQDLRMSDDGYVYTWGDSPGWPFPDNSKFDTRHFDTNARFITACQRYAAWTGDVDLLKDQAERIRKAMNYQLAVLRGQDGLIIAASKDVNGKHMGCGDNYWDILPFGHLDAYANVQWYASVLAMAQIEEMLSNSGGAETRAPAHPSTFYRDLAAKARGEYNRTFWDDSKGRYIGCVDVDGNRRDYGFTFVNLEAMAAGLADEVQSKRIYHWMETEPTSTGKPDVYTAYVFAPRATTIHNPRWDPKKGKLDDVPQDPWWQEGWRGTVYGAEQCQDGGAILYTSYFDLMARASHVGIDNAWTRWQEIIGRWRLPDHICGGSPLYRGERPQQIDAGAVGTDIPFPESALVPCWLLYGVMGIQATPDGLEIAPKLPKGMPWFEIRNVAYHGLALSIRTDGKTVTVTCTDLSHRFTWRRVLGSGGKVLFIPSNQ